jgi:hypothetical protein
MGFNAAQQNLISCQLVQLAVELLSAAATESSFIRRFVVGKELRYIRHCRSERIGTLLTPQKWNTQDFGGFDENLNVPKQGLSAVHQLRQLALDVNDHQTALLYIKHPYLLIMILILTVFSPST